MRIPPRCFIAVSSSAWRFKRRKASSTLCI
jgi:hypothetical protein